MERSLLNLKQIPETTSCCPHLCTLKKNPKSLQDEDIMTYLLALGHCSRSIGFPSISPPLDTIGLRTTFGLGSMELWTSINMSLANTTHRRLREHRREQNTDPQHLTMTLENILCCPHLFTLNKFKNKNNLINEMMRTSQLLVESALGQSVSPLSPFWVRLSQEYVRVGLLGAMGLHITWVSTTSHSFSGMMVDLGEALLPWPNMCALLLRIDLTTTPAGGCFLGLCAFWRQSRLEDDPLQECSMPPGFTTPLNACCMFKLGDAWVYTNLAGSARKIYGG